MFILDKKTLNLLRFLAKSEKHNLLFAPKENPATDFRGEKTEFLFMKRRETAIFKIAYLGLFLRFPYQPKCFSA